jgi:hypothetical protein
MFKVSRANQGPQGRTDQRRRNKIFLPWKGIRIAFRLSPRYRGSLSFFLFSFLLPPCAREEKLKREEQEPRTTLFLFLKKKKRFPHYKGHSRAFARKRRTFVKTEKEPTKAHPLKSKKTSFAFGPARRC